MPGWRPIWPGGGRITTVSGTGTAVAIGNARQFWVNSAGDAWLAVRGNNTTGAMDLTNSTPIGAGLYGPFDVAPGRDTHIHVAGAGGTPVVTITLAG